MMFQIFSYVCPSCTYPLNRGFLSHEAFPIQLGQLGIFHENQPAWAAWGILWIEHVGLSEPFSDVWTIFRQPHLSTIVAIPWKIPVNHQKVPWNPIKSHEIPLNHHEIPWNSYNIPIKSHEIPLNHLEIPPNSLKHNEFYHHFRCADPPTSPWAPRAPTRPPRPPRSGRWRWLCAARSWGDH